MLLTYTRAIFKLDIHLTFFLCFVIQSAIYSQTTLIPDANFEQALIEMNIDTNGFNGNILNNDASNITTLYINDRGIYNLNGIEAFTNLKYLFCFNNHIDTINITQNTALEILDIQENKVAAVDLSHNLALKELYISSNLLNDIDISHNLNLEFLSCNLNFISNLSITNNTALRGLWCYSNNLDAINISTNINLEVLFCSGNNLNTLDLSQNTNLITLSCGSNNLSNLSINSNTALTYLGCSANRIDNLDLSNNTLLERVLCNNNHLTELDVSNANNLLLLYSQNNNIRTLNFSNNSNLRYFRAENNNLTHLDFRNSHNNMIADFNVMQNPDLTCIYVDDATASYLNAWSIDDNSNFVENETVCNTLSLDDEIINDFNIFPNPASEIVSVTLNQSQANFQLYSISGKLVLSKQLNYGENRIHLSNLSSGIYLVRLNSEQSSITKKLIIN